MKSIKIKIKAVKRKEIKMAKGRAWRKDSKEEEGRGKKEKLGDIKDKREEGEHKKEGEKERKKKLKDTAKED